MHYIECGWPGSNPKDAAFFQRTGRSNLGGARLAAFGSIRRKDYRCEADANLQALLAAGTPVITLVGKSWDYHVREVLATTPEENLAMIGDSVAWMNRQGREVVFDAEHYYDGFLADPDYALATLQAAADAGTDWITLCETNGGKLPWQVEEITRAVSRRLPQAGSACTATTTAAVPWPTRSPPCAQAAAWCRARSTAMANWSAMPISPPSCPTCS